MVGIKLGNTAVAKHNHLSQPMHNSFKQHHVVIATQMFHIAFHIQQLKPFVRRGTENVLSVVCHSMCGNEIVDTVNE